MVAEKRKLTRLKKKEAPIKGAIVFFNENPEALIVVNSCDCDIFCKRSAEETKAEQGIASGRMGGI